MYLEHPHLRCDGIYVSRNTYFRLGIVHWDVKNPVHLVVYYRSATEHPAPSRNNVVVATHATVTTPALAACHIHTIQLPCIKRRFKYNMWQHMAAPGTGRTTRRRHAGTLGSSRTAQC